MALDNGGIAAGKGVYGLRLFFGGLLKGMRWDIVLFMGEWSADGRCAFSLPDVSTSCINAAMTRHLCVGTGVFRCIRGSV